MEKMTKLQTIRKSLMEQLAKIENGEANAENVSNIIGISDSMVKTYNVELRTRELELRAIEELEEFNNRSCEGCIYDTFQNDKCIYCSRRCVDFYETKGE